MGAKIHSVVETANILHWEKSYCYKKTKALKNKSMFHFQVYYICIIIYLFFVKIFSLKTLIIIVLFCMSFYMLVRRNMCRVWLFEKSKCNF